MKKVPVTIAVVVGLAVALLLLTGTRGGLAYFSPYTFQYQTQSEFAVLGGALTIYRSARRDTENEMVTFLRETGFVSPETPESQRWEQIFHWNSAWKDGDGPLYDLFFRNRWDIIEWSKADPERASIYWSEGFKRLRSDNDVDVSVGQTILRYGWRCKSPVELRKEIALIENEFAEIEKNH